MIYSIKKIEDAELISLYIQGNEQCLSELVSRHQQKIFGFILSKTGDQNLANDLFQDTFIKIIQTLKRGRYQEEGKFLPWALRIAHNLVMDYYRNSKRKNTKRVTDQFEFVGLLDEEISTIEDVMIQQQTVQKILKLIENLPEDQKEVLKLRIFNSLSFKEIAEQTHVSINTSLGRMRYALINLRKMLNVNNEQH